MKKLILVTLLLIFACDKSEQNHSACACMAASVVVNAVDENGESIELDTLYFVINKDTTKFVKISNDSLLRIISDGDTITSSYYESALFNNKEGDYKVWCYYNGEVSETVDVKVERTGNPSCDLTSTMEVKFEFGKSEKSIPLIKRLGSCGD